MASVTVYYTIQAELTSDTVSVTGLKKPRVRLEDGFFTVGESDGPGTIKARAIFSAAKVVRIEINDSDN